MKRSTYLLISEIMFFLAAVYALNFAENNLLKKEKCKKCWAKYYCSGGCAANAIKYGGNINKPYELSCELMRKRIECAIAVNCVEKQNEQ